jgi:protein-disulfide isomerase
MPETDKRTISFILGSFLLLLTFILIFMISSGTSKNISPYTDTPTMVDTNDPFITRQLTERDFLPIDVPLITFLDPQRGPENASIQIVEFSDFQCPFCKEFQSTLDVLLARFPEIQHVWKDAPSQALHRQAFSAHVAARCAQDQNAFWEYHDELFQYQDDLTSDRFVSIAEDLNLNVRAWSTCYEQEETRVQVERSITEAEVLGIDATPFLFINNQRISGNISYNELEQLIIKELQ